MTYPRMNKADYPPLPEVINTEAEYNLVLEYIVFAATQIEQLQHKCKNPLLNAEQREKQENTVKAAMIRYDQLCLILDDYKQRHPHFNYEQAIKHLRS